MYLTPLEAEQRLLTRFDLRDVVLAEGDVAAASAALDDLAPFKGEKADENQEREFPRDGDLVVPDAVLDYVALGAYLLSLQLQPAPVSSEKIGSVSVSYGTPRLSQTQLRMAALIDPLLERRGARA